MKNTYKYILPIIFTLTCCELDDPTATIDINSIITIASEDGNKMLADSISSVTIKAVLESKAMDGQTVMFKTDNGILTLPGETPNTGSMNELIVTSGQREILVQLHANTIPAENVVVAATVGNFTNTTKLSFTTAFPESINVAPSAVEALTFDPISLYIKSYRSEGMVSEGVIYEISSVVPDSIVLTHPSIGEIRNGQSSFTVNNISQKMGEATILVKVPIDEENMIVESVVITYK